MEHKIEILKYIHESRFCCLCHGLAFPQISQKQYSDFSYALFVCLSWKIEAGDSGQGFRDKYVQQLVVTLEILSIWPNIEAYSCFQVWVLCSNHQKNAFNYKTDDYVTTLLFLHN